jgi:hypothetical protein
VRVSGGTATDMSNANFTISVPSGSYATLPYSTGFEGGSLDQYWFTGVTGDGRVRVLSTNTPHSGTYHMVMDDATAGGFNQTDARLRLNLAGQTQVNLSYWWKDFGDETHTQDGIFFSNNGGSSYVKVASLNGGSFSDNTWRNFTLDVDALAAANGLTLNSTFVIEFQQYDDYPITTDGFCFDDISVTVPTGGGGITAESEPNNTSGTADGPIGTGVAVSGAISSASDQDFYFLDVNAAGNINISVSIGSSADLDWFLYNSAMTEVARGYSTANPEVGNYNAAVGHYFLMVDGYLSATSSYSLTVSGGLANSIIPQQKDFVAGKSLVVTSLLQNAPNPFHANTGIAFTLAQKGHVDLEVFDPRGRLVATLVSQDMNAGPHQVQWVTKTDRGEDVPAGVYFYRLKTLEFVQTRRMVVMP